jgi:protein-tyrosine-phosphatase/DNA-binding HxlR family transcriptional regulator
MTTPGTTDYDDALALARVLTDAVVWRLVKSLAASDAHLRDLQASLGVQQPEVLEERLKQLEQLGLVTSRTSDAAAGLRYYRLQVDRLRAVVEQVIGALHPSLRLAPEPETLPAEPVRPRVLFLCTENSARSQLAEVLLRQLSRGSVEAYSAGTRPGAVNPLVAEILGEAAQGLRSKHIDEFLGQHFDYVVTVCDRAREACPSFTGADKQLHWSIPDPAAVEGEEARRRAFSVAACELTQRIRYLLTFMGPRQRGAQPVAVGQDERMP